MFVRTLVAIFLALTSLFVTGVALADPETNVSSGLTAKGRGLAVHGYDVVAYFTDGGPKIGDAKFSAIYHDATYRFASVEHLKAFRNNPKKYLPQYGGYCAYGVAVGGKFDGDPRLWRIVDNKLYLNLSREVQELWQSDIPGYIKRADRTWSRIATKTPKELS